VTKKTEQTDRTPILIEQGEYEAQCIAYKEFRQFGGKQKLCLEWDFSISGGQGIILPQYFNMEHKTFKDNTKYHTDWVIANNLIRPARPTRAYMSPKIFINVIGIVSVKTCKPKFGNGKEKPDVFHYSVVECLYSLSMPNSEGSGF